MKPPTETIRISKQGRDQLLKLRRQTGIEHWNIICRWALCVSIKESSKPPVVTQKLEGGVEMNWKVFSGEKSDIYSALIWIKAVEDGFGLTPEGGAICLRAHLHRGLSYLSSGTEPKSLTDITNKLLKEESIDL